MDYVWSIRKACAPTVGTLIGWWWWWWFIFYWDDRCKLVLDVGIHTFIHTTHALSPKGSRGISDIVPRPAFYQNYLPVRNTADVTGGKPIAVWLQSISGVNAINPIVALYDIHVRKREVLFFYFVPDTTRYVGISYYNSEASFYSYGSHKSSLADMVAINWCSRWHRLTVWTQSDYAMNKTYAALCSPS
jgi:hypothetical protein